MQGKIKIIGIGGSLEPKSSTLAMLRYTINEIKSLGSEIKLIDLKDVNLPLYNYSLGLEQAGEGFKETLDEIHEAHGYVFASPEYHGTVSASFKNFIDYFEFLYDYNPPYLTGKPIGCLAVGGADNSGSTTLQTMINIVHNLRGIAASSSLAIGAAVRQINENGELENEVLKRKLRRLAEETYNLSVKLKS
jgi:FMN reductase